MFKTVLLLLLLLLFISAPTGVVVVVWGFSAAVVRPASSSRRVLIATHLSATTTTAATLTFTAQIDCTSDPILCEDGNGVTNDDVMEFFCTPSSFTQSFLNSNGESFQVLPLSDDYRQLWNDVCDNEAYRYGRELAPPGPSLTVSGETADCLIVMSNANSQYPGLAVVSTITNGVQLLLPQAPKSDQTQQTQYPCYRILLLSDTRTAKGSPVAVWLYNLLTKTKSNSTRASTAAADEDNDNNEDDTAGSISDQNSFKTRRPTCRSVATVTLVPWYGNITDDGTDSANNVPVLKGHVLNVQAEVNVFIDVPQLVVKLLPMSLERMEQVGSQSMQATIDADIATALTRTACAMVAWRNGSDSDEKEQQAATSTHNRPLAV